jgi:hypothetical protein
MLDPGQSQVTFAVGGPVGPHKAFVAQRRWGRAYRNGEMVCDRVEITIGRDDRLGLTRRERRYVLARFQERLEGGLRTELTRLVRRRGAAARRVADGLETIELMVDGAGEEPERIIGCLLPPQVHHGRLRDIAFGLRELGRSQ